MKKIISIILTAAILTTVFSFGFSGASASAANEVYSGVTGDLTWSFDTYSKIFTLSGEGKTADYGTFNDTPWYSYAKQATMFQIGEGVQEIDPDVLFYFTNVVQYKVDDNNMYFASIRNHLYSKDGTVIYRLAKVYNQPAQRLEDSVKVINDYAFAGMEMFSSEYTIPEGVEAIGHEAFRKVGKLSSLIIPNTVTQIGSYAFLDSSSLESIVIPESISKLSTGVFKGTKLSSIRLPSTVTEIPPYCFCECGYLKTVSVSNGIEKIGSNAFENAKSFSTLKVIDGENESQDGCVTCPSSLKTIGSGAFRSAGLNKIITNDGLEEIESYAFEESRLTSAETRGEIPLVGTGIIKNSSFTQYNTVDNIIYFGDYVVDSVRKTNQKYDLVIREGTVGIADDAISWGVNTLSMPASLKYIGENPFPALPSVSDFTLSEDNKSFHIVNGVLYDIADTRLHKCLSNTEVVEVDIPETVEKIDRCAFSYCGKLETVRFPTGLKSLGREAFVSCSSLKSADIPEGIVDILFGVFSDCTSLCEVNLSEKTRYLGYRAFQNTSIERIELPDTLATIETEAFKSCANLKSVVVPDSVTAMKSWVFASCKSLETAVIGSGVTQVQAYTFSSCSALKNVLFKSEQTTLYKYTFYGCSSLESVTGIDNVTYFGEYAMYNCKSLSGYTIPKNVIYIGSYSFAYSSNITLNASANKLTKILEKAFYAANNFTPTNIGKAVTQIGTEAFAFCSDLKKIRLTEKLKTLGSNAFQSSGLEEISLPASIVKVPEGLCSYCKNLTDIEFADGITHVGERSFLSCPNISKVICPPSMWFFYEEAFKNCGNLREVYINNPKSSLSYDSSYLSKCSFNSCANLSDIFFSYPEKELTIKWQNYMNKYPDINYHFTEYPTEPSSATQPGSDATQATEPSTGEATQPSSATEPTSPTQPEKVVKKANPIKVIVKTKTVKLSKLSKAKQTVTPIIVRKVKGKVVYKKLSGSKYLTLKSNGKIVVKKGSKKGTYTARIKITAKGNAKYKSKSKTVKIKIMVIK
ncbi:MAG: leucine-rich repeat domain-containing protein [Ruminococcus sp.]|nr:leucine-rich repeat domain-containing protein [Ruminococcus sp.]